MNATNRSKRTGIFSMTSDKLMLILLVAVLGQIAMSFSAGLDLAAAGTKEHIVLAGSAPEASPSSEARPLSNVSYVTTNY